MQDSKQMASRPELLEMCMERGDPTVSVGTLATALFVLQLHERLADLAAPAEDALALSLDEAHLPKRIRGRRA